MPHVEAGRVYASEHGESSNAVSPCESQAVSAPSEDSGHGGERHEGGEQRPEPRLGLPDAEALVVVVQIRLLLNLGRLLIAQLPTDEGLSLEQLVDLVERTVVLFAEEEGKVARGKVVECDCALVSTLYNCV